MKLLALAAASGLALTAGACVQTAPAPRATLDCPATQGDLTRTSVSADRRTCGYRTRDGGEVTLQLVAVTDSADQTLRDIETSLVGDAARERDAAAIADAGGNPKSVAEDNRSAAQDAAEDAQDAAEDAEDARKAAEEAASDAKASGAPVSGEGRVRIEKDGRTIVSTGDGESAHIRLPGIHIDTEGEDASVKIGGLMINAQNDEATVRISRDVRLKGQAFSREKRGVRATFIYTGKNLPNGYRLVGYEAAGPKVGPLTVAVVKSRSDSDDGGDVYGDVKKLVRRNAGV